MFTEKDLKDNIQKTNPDFKIFFDERKKYKLYLFKGQEIIPINLYDLNNSFETADEALKFLLTDKEEVKEINFNTPEFKKFYNNKINNFK